MPDVGTAQALKDKLDGAPKVRMTRPQLPIPPPVYVPRVWFGMWSGGLTSGLGHVWQEALPALFAELAKENSICPSAVRPLPPPYPCQPCPCVHPAKALPRHSM